MPGLGRFLPGTVPAETDDRGADAAGAGTGTAKGRLIGCGFRFLLNFNIYVAAAASSGKWRRWRLSFYEFTTRAQSRKCHCERSEAIQSQCEMLWIASLRSQ